MRTIALIGLVVGAAVGISHVGLGAQAPAKPAPTKPAAAPARPAAGARVQGNLLQVMRGVVYPASNVVFAAQQDPAAVKPAEDPSTSPNPLSSSYGGWTAVENAGITLAESANLLTIPGRTCSNGKPVPMRGADWAPFVQGLRDAGMSVYKAAQTKNVDTLLEAVDQMTLSCSNCHDVYREKTNAQGGLAARCTK
ncbi:MAG: hypothetical protein EXQ48_07595 [Acidobacteria bacterium]|nr:hypothetical protein [Acidobacteriota bacterium]